MTTVPISDIQEYYREKGLRQSRTGIRPNHNSTKVKTRTWGFWGSWKRICSYWITDFCDLFEEHRKSLAFPIDLSYWAQISSCLLLLGPVPQQMHPLILKKVLHVGGWQDVEEKSQHPGIFFCWSQEYSVESKPNCLSHIVPKGNSPPCWDSWTNWENITMTKMGWS